MKPLNYYRAAYSMVGYSSFPNKVFFRGYASGPQPVRPLSTLLDPAVRKVAKTKLEFRFLPGLSIRVMYSIPPHLYNLAVCVIHESR